MEPSCGPPSQELIKTYGENDDGTLDDQQIIGIKAQKIKPVADYRQYQYPAVQVGYHD